MNWSALAFDWNQVRAFLATVEEGSLSAAARALGQSQPTIGRQIAALEESLGVALLERVGRGVEVTPTGLELVEHVRAMGEAAGRISLAASGQSQAAEGLVSVSVSDIYAAYLLPPIVARMRAEMPGIELEIVAANEISDLRRREADIAIRHVAPTDPALFARRVADETGGFYAAQSLLDVLGRPETAEDLARLPFVAIGAPEEMLAQMASRGIDVPARQFGVRTGSGVVYWEMVRGGLGVGLLPDRIAGAMPDLERIAPFVAPMTFPTWIAAHRELKTSRKVRLVFDFLAEALGR